MSESAGEAIGNTPSASLSKEEADEMAQRLINGELNIADVPASYHQSLYSALSLAKFEARIGERMELYDKINDIMWSMKLTPVMPEREVYLPMCSLTSPTRCRGATTGRLTQTMFSHNVSLVKAVTSRDAPIGEAAIRKLENQLTVSQKFWADEEARFYNMRDKSLAKMKKQHAAFKFSKNPIDADEERNRLACEFNNLKRDWVAKESKFFAEKNAELRRIRSEIRRVQGETARSLIESTRVYEEEECGGVEEEHAEEHVDQTGPGTIGGEEEEVIEGGNHEVPQNEFQGDEEQIPDGEGMLMQQEGGEDFQEIPDGEEMLMQHEGGEGFQEIPDGEEMLMQEVGHEWAPDGEPEEEVPEPGQDL